MCKRRNVIDGSLEGMHAGIWQAPVLVVPKMQRHSGEPHVLAAAAVKLWWRLDQAHSNAIRNCISRTSAVAAASAATARRPPQLPPAAGRHRLTKIMK